jgi:hypothetical protein
MGTSLSRIVLENRGLVSGVVAAGVWAASRTFAPLPGDNPVLVLILNAKPHIYYAISTGYAATWFTTPFVASSLILLFAYICLMRRGIPFLTKGEVANRLRLSFTSIRRSRLERLGPRFIKVGSLERGSRVLPRLTADWRIPSCSNGGTVPAGTQRCRRTVRVTSTTASSVVTRS